MLKYQKKTHRKFNIFFFMSWFCQKFDLILVKNDQAYPLVIHYQI
jgi:hypothetical protein